MFNQYGVPLMNPHVSNQSSVPLMNPCVSNQLNSDVITKLRETVNPSGSDNGNESEAANQVQKVSICVSRQLYSAPPTNPHVFNQYGVPLMNPHV